MFGVMIRPPRPAAIASPDHRDDLALGDPVEPCSVEMDTVESLDRHPTPPSGSFARYRSETSEGGTKWHACSIWADWDEAAPRSSNVCSASCPASARSARSSTCGSATSATTNAAAAAPGSPACTFWKRVGEAGVRRLGTGGRRAGPRAAGPGRAHPAHPPARRGTPRRRRTVREYASFYARVYAAAAEVAGAARGRRLVEALRAGPRAALGRRRGPAGRSRGPGRARRRVLLDQDRGPAGDRRHRRDDPLLPRCARPLLWNAHNAAFGLLARRGVPVRRIRYEQFLADPRAACARAGRVRRSPGHRARPGVSRRGTRGPVGRAQRGRQPDAFHGRPGAAAPRRRLDGGAAARLSAGWSARSARRCSARTDIDSTHRRRDELAVRRRGDPHP